VKFVEIKLEVLAAPTTKRLVVWQKFYEGMEEHTASILRVREIAKQEIMELKAYRCGSCYIQHTQNLETRH
jgi:hypothetical protein